MVPFQVENIKQMWQEAHMRRTHSTGQNPAKKRNVQELESEPSSPGGIQNVCLRLEG